MRRFSPWLLAWLLLAAGAHAAPGDVVSETKISDTVGGLAGPFSNSARFGSGSAALGDLDGDGDFEVAVGAPFHAVGGGDVTGIVEILSLNAAGTSVGQVRIAEGLGGFTGTLDPGDEFGASVTRLGDLDGDGFDDIAVGAPGDDDGQSNAGAVWILFLNANGTVKSHAKLSRTQGGIGTAINADDRFGSSVAGLGDVNGDGRPDLAVGMPFDDGGGLTVLTASNAGNVMIVLLNQDGSVRSAPTLDFGGLDIGPQVTDPGTGATFRIAFGTEFGAAVGGIGDLDQDGVPDLVVGAPSTGVATATFGPPIIPIHERYGAIWVVLLENNGTTKEAVKHGGVGGLGGALDEDDAFGSSLTALGDVDGDGVQDVLIGAPGDDDGGANRGAAWVMFLNPDGSAKGFDKISSTAGGFGGALDGDDAFGASAAGLGDFDLDGDVEVAVGANDDDDGGFDRGAVWILDLDGSPGVCGNAVQDPVEQCDDGGNASGDGCAAACEVEDDVLLSGLAQGGSVQMTVDGFLVSVATSPGETAAQVAAALAAAVEAHPTLDARGVTAVAVSARVYTTGLIAAVQSLDAGIVLSPNGSVLAEHKISDTSGGFSGELSNFDRLGGAVAPLGDLDGDGVGDLAVGAGGDDDGGSGRGAVWILFRNADGSVKAEQKISATSGGFTGTLDDLDAFGTALAALGDVDGDGFTELAVGAPGDDDGGSGRGAVWLLYLNSDGTVASHQKIATTDAAFAGSVADNDQLGTSVTALSDVDGDGVTDLAVGAPGADQGGADAGSVYVLRLRADGSVKAAVRIDDNHFGLLLDAGDGFGAAVSRVGDLDDDGIQDLAIGAPGDDDGSGFESNRGAVWIAFLTADGTPAGFQKLSETEGDLSAPLQPGDRFGSALAALGDVDADGVEDLAVGAAFDVQNGAARGAVWVLLLDPDGTIAFDQKLSTTAGGFGGALDDGDEFGGALAALPDLNGDGAIELAVGAAGDDDGGANRGAVWTLFLAAAPCACGDGVLDPGEECDGGDNLTGDGCSAVCQLEDRLYVGGRGEGGSVQVVVDGVLISVTTGAGDSAEQVAAALAEAINANATLQLRGTSALVIGNIVITDGALADPASFDAGMRLNLRIGTVQDHSKISPLVGGFTGSTLGGSLAGIGDLDGDGHVDLAVSGVSTSFGRHVLFLAPDGTVVDDPALPFRSVVAALGDIDGDGVRDLAMGDPNDDDGGTPPNANRGAIRIHLMNQDGTIEATGKISDTQGGFGGTLQDGDLFGSAVASLGDLDGDGIADLAVGASGTDDGGGERGALWILFFAADGSIRHEQKISDTQGGFDGELHDGDAFGIALATLGDLDGDGSIELAVGANGDDDGADSAGAVWIVSLAPDGRAVKERKISALSGGFTGDLDEFDDFGTALAAVGDLDGNGVADLAVGANFDDDGGFAVGAVWLLLLQADGSVVGHQKLSSLEGGFEASLAAGDWFGGGVAALGDLDGDGVGDLAVSAEGDDDNGAVYVLNLDAMPLVCGDGSIGPIEQCDDGNALGGDGCSATCETEQAVRIFGAAQGGSVSLTASGVGLVVPTSSGQTPEQVASNVAAAVAASAALQGLGKAHTLVDHALWIEGTLQDASTSDPGLIVSFDPGLVVDEQKIGLDGDGLAIALDADDHFGDCTSFLGDLDGDGIGDIAVGAPGDDDGGVDRGAVHVLFLNADGTVKQQRKISSPDFVPFVGGVATLSDGDAFGSCVAGIGDLDGDGVPDLAAGATGEDTNGSDRGSVWILFLHADGSPKFRQQLVANTTMFTSGNLPTAGARLGAGLASIGDVDGDGVGDVAVGAAGHDGGGTDRGGVWILLLRPDGTVRRDLPRFDAATLPELGLADGDRFGISIAALGDLDGDGTGDLAVAASGKDDAGSDAGAVYVLFLNPDGSVRESRKLDAAARGLAIDASPGDELGLGLTALGDIDDDGVPDLAVGARHDESLGLAPGSSYVLLLRPDGRIKARKRVTLQAGGFEGVILDGDAFGASLAAVRNAGEPTKLAAAAPLDDGGILTGDYGAVWLLELDGVVPVCGNGGRDLLEECDDGGVANLDGCSASCTLEDQLAVYGTALGGGASVTLAGVTVAVVTSAGQTADQVAAALAAAIDADATLAAKGVTASASGAGVTASARFASGGTTDPGLFVDLTPGLVIGEREVDATDPVVGPELTASDELATGLAYLGDLDHDGVGEVAVGAPEDDDGGSNRGAVYILFRNADDTIASFQKISDTAGGFAGVLANNDRFGASVAALGDLDGNGVPELAVGAPEGDAGGSDFGAVWILFLNEDGTVAAEQKIASATGGFTGVLEADDEFGSALASPGDLDGDGVRDLAVVAPGNWVTGGDAGAVWILFLEPGGGVKGHAKITAASAGLVLVGAGGISNSSHLASVAALGDLDGNGVPDLAVGGPYDDEGFEQAGAVWILFLEADGSVSASQKLAATHPLLAGELGSATHFGGAVGSLGDVDGDGRLELGVGARDEDGGRGAVYLLSLESDGTLFALEKISDSEGGFAGPLFALDRFGTAVAGLGTRAGFPQIAVGAPLDDGDGSPTDTGSAWLLTLDGVAPVCGNAILDPAEECDDGATQDGDGCSASCEVEDELGVYGTALGGGVAVTVDGVPLNVATSANDTAAQVAAAIVAAIQGDATLAARGVGAVALGSRVVTNGSFSAASASDAGLILDLTPGLVIAEREIGSAKGGFLPALDAGDQLGVCTAYLGDLDRDGIGDVAVGAHQDDDGLTDQGAVYVLLLNADGSVKASQKIAAAQGGFGGVIGTADRFGACVAALGDLDGDGIPDLAVGEPDDNATGGAGTNSHGAVWILFLQSDGTVKAAQKINGSEGGFGSGLGANDRFGAGLAALGDLDGDGLTELAVSAPGDDDSGSNTGAAWILFLNADGTVASKAKVTYASAGLAANGGALDALARLGDLNGDGLPDLAVGDAGDDDGGADAGAVWILLLNADGSVAAHQKLGPALPELASEIGAGDRFGDALASLGDFDGDGRLDLAVGATQDDDGATDSGAAYLLTLESDGSLASVRKISRTRGGFPGAIDGDRFGASVAGLGPRGFFPQLAVGAVSDLSDRGAAWVLTLDGVPPLCGDGILDPAEECDDGDAFDGDGCASICELQDALALAGIAQGGAVEVTVDGVLISVGTSNGQSAANVVAALASAIAAHPTLQFLGTTALTQGTTLLVNGRIQGWNIADPGLVEGGGAPQVPALGAPGLALLAAALLAAATWARSAGRRRAGSWCR